MTDLIFSGKKKLEQRELACGLHLTLRCPGNGGKTDASKDK